MKPERLAEIRKYCEWVANFKAPDLTGLNAFEIINARQERQPETYEYYAVELLEAYDALANASPTPDLTARIEAAAEEIENIHLEHVGGSMTKDALAAIIRRHLEGGG